MNRNMRKKIMSIILTLAMVLSLLPAMSITASAGTGTAYNFENLGTVADANGYVTVGDYFKVEANKYTLSYGVMTGTLSGIYPDDAQANNSFLSDPYSIIIKAEGGASCKTFTFEDLGLSAYSGCTNPMFSSFDITFYDISGNIIGSKESLGGSSIEVDTASVSQLSSIYPAHGEWNVSGVASIEIEFVFSASGGYAESNLQLENITVANISTAIPSTLTTQGVSSISATTATGNGNITSLGTPNPTAHGVCWNTTGTPTTANSKVDNGAAPITGAFTASMTGLSPNTTYYVRAYATNTAGTSYGAQVSFTTSIAPSISTHPTNSAIEIGDNTSFTVAATGTDLTYQWQVNTGSGFTNITNGGVYSNAATDTLNITGATVGMNGYLYRVIVSGSVAPAVTSNEASLTVSEPPSISINDPTVAEGDSGTTTLQYTVTLSAISGKTVTVNYATADGTATAGSDYTSTSGALAFSPGETIKTITVPVNGDVTEEADQTVLVNLSAPTNATISDSQGTGTITNDDGPPVITIDDVSIAEGNAGTTDLTFTVSLNKVGANSITVDYATANNTAAAGTDYASASGILTFAPGETTKAAIITLSGDVNYENSETFYINLTNVVNASIGDAQGVGTITNDDSVPAVTLSLSGSPLAEDGGVAAVTATLSHLSYQNVTVNLSYSGTASGADYTTSGAVITIPAGSVSGAAIITATSDLLDEDNETVIVDIASVANGTETGTQQVTATITDDDAPPSISINDPTVTEGDAGTATLQYTVTLSEASGKTVTINYATADGTATAGSDYTGTSGALTFSPGETSKTITVTVNGDVTEEADQTVLVNLSTPTNVTISDSQGTGTITNDDGPPVITIDDVSIAEGNAGTTDLTFTVSLNKVGVNSITVDYATANNTASAGTDYASSVGTLTFAPGETTKAAIVTVSGDVNYENSETFYINLTNAVNASISDAQGVGTITNDDSVPAVTLSLSGSPLAEDGGVAAVTATMSHLSYQNVTVNLGYSGTALGNDYTTSGAVITIPAGSLTGTAIITGVNDLQDEDNKTVIVDIASVTNGNESGTQQVTATITDDDAPPGISINDPSVAEGDAGTATLQFTVSLSAASGKTVTVEYAAANGTATAGSDYTAASGTLTFAPGETSKNINIAVNGDVTEEPNETVLVNLTVPANASISDSQGSGTIMNDEADTTPPGAVTNIRLADSDTTSGVDGRDFTIGFDDSADDATDVLNYKIYVYKDGEEPANKAAMDALAAGNKDAVKTIARTAGDDGTDANLGSGAATDSRGQALAGGDYWIVVTAVDRSGNYSFSKTAAKVTITSDSSNSSSGGGGSSSNSSNSGSDIIVNGEKLTAGTSSTQTVEGRTVTTITVDDAKLDKILEEKVNSPTITIPSTAGSDVTVGVLNGQTVKSMEDKEAVLEIKTESVSYTLPASEININDVSSQFGEAVQLKDIKISVSIAEPPADTVRIVEDTANKNSYQIVVKPVEFEITCTNGDKTISVSKFNGYVERTVAIPDGVDPSKITTGIVLNADGTFSHVPTTIVKIDGKYYAKINSLTNSTYSVIYNPVTFADVANHWAKDEINDMGSRLVVSGIGNENYGPNRDITRAEFAAIIIRALGLKSETAENSFTDVKISAWYAGYVETAVSYGIITGYSNGKFGPNDKITREQAMTMIARAMKLTGLYSTLTEAEMGAQISSYADGASSSKYAIDGIATCLKTGVVSGTNSNKLAPKDYITRAEVAVVIERMLKKSELI